MRAFFAPLAMLLLVASANGAPKVITSIMPVHSITAAVMGETGMPELLLSGRISEHTASFTATQISKLGKADLVFIIGGGSEPKLAQLGGSESVGGRKFVELSRVTGVVTLQVREGGSWDAHQPTEGEGILAFDPHVWLDPENAKAMAAAVAAELTRTDPANAGTYAANVKRFAAETDAASAEITASLAGVKDRPFIVFHDAFQYFEKRFGLNGVGAITDISARPPSAQRLQEIRGQLTRTGAVCVFREPQFKPGYADVVTEGSLARSGILDPVGAELEPGPHAYRMLLQNLTAAFKACLSG